MMSHPVKLIIDTDPGIDDALAIFLALGHRSQSEVQVLALTTTYGNSPDVRQMSNNAQKILNLAKQPLIPIYEGAASPLIVDTNIETYVEQALQAQSVFIHGRDGLGDISPPLPGEWTPKALSAAEAIVQLVRQYPHEIEVVTLGPLTNLALAIMICPSIVSRIKRVVMMGGALSSPRGHPTNTPDANCGNVTACAEANIYKDPHAAHRVFNAGFPAADLIMVPIDLTTQTCYASSNIHDVLTSTASAIGDFIQRSHALYIDSYLGLGRSSVPFHDSCAVFFALCPTEFTTELVSVDVETKGTLTFGMTVIDGRLSRKTSNVTVCRSVNAPALYDALKHAICRLNEIVMHG